MVKKKLQFAFPLIHIADGNKRREEFPVKQRSRKEMSTFIITEISENCVMDNLTPWYAANVITLQSSQYTVDVCVRACVFVCGLLVTTKGTIYDARQWLCGEKCGQKSTFCPKMFTRCLTNRGEEVRNFVYFRFDHLKVFPPSQ